MSIVSLIRQRRMRARRRPKSDAHFHLEPRATEACHVVSVLVYNYYMIDLTYTPISISDMNM